MELPALIRMVAVPLIGIAAVQDLRKRRVYDQIWVAIVALAIIAFAVEVSINEFPSITTQMLQILFLSAGALGGMGVLFARLGWFGWADAGALISIGVLFPVVRPLDLGIISLPPSSLISLLSFDMIFNSAIIIFLFPVVFLLINYQRGEVGFPQSLYLISFKPDELYSVYGTVYYISEVGNWVSGVNIEVVERYLQWRHVTVSSVLDDPEGHMPSDSVSETIDNLSSLPLSQPIIDPEPPHDQSLNDSDGGEDRWGAERFYEETSIEKFGSSPEDLRKTLDQIFVEDSDALLSVGIPFVSVIFFGVMTTLIFGGLLGYITQFM